MQWTQLDNSPAVPARNTRFACSGCRNWIGFAQAERGRDDYGMILSCVRFALSGVEGSLVSRLCESAAVAYSESVPFESPTFGIRTQEKMRGELSVYKCVLYKITQPAV